MTASRWARALGVSGRAAQRGTASLAALTGLDPGVPRERCTGAITRTHLVNAIADANAKIKPGDFGTCLGLLTAVRCYSADPDEHARFGVEDGLEMLGSGTSRMGGDSNAPQVYTDYRPAAQACYRPAPKAATLHRSKSECPGRDWGARRFP